MALDDDNHNTSVLDMTVGIVANYVSNNRIDPDAVGALIASTYQALTTAGSNQPAEEPAEDLTKSRSEIRKSITDDGLVSFIDGKSYRTLKRHLSTNGMTPDEYRARYGLPSDYPIVAPSYSAQRSAMAKALGLGQGGRKPAAAAKPARKPPAKKVTT